MWNRRFSYNHVRFLKPRDFSGTRLRDYNSTGRGSLMKWRKKTSQSSHCEAWVELELPHSSASLEYHLHGEIKRIEGPCSRSMVGGQCQKKGKRTQVLGVSRSKPLMNAGVTGGP